MDLTRKKEIDMRNKIEHIEIDGVVYDISVESPKNNSPKTTGRRGSMTVFLEVLSAILLAAKMMGMIEMSTTRALFPLIISVVLQIIFAIIGAAVESKS